jgi:uncharacterized membrane-anchored protein YitT (DUF2179 family)
LIGYFLLLLGEIIFLSFLNHPYIMLSFYFVSKNFLCFFFFVFYNTLLLFLGFSEILLAPGCEKCEKCEKLMWQVKMNEEAVSSLLQGGVDLPISKLPLKSL